ncbi:cell wall / vacuolar inhibitor of fructosidase 1-like [Chenopodium quinoa]|uniref:cell wall / vacuolar inhibitor of fructosidase 1-like n=1 Tax=Chenopodium quinoa TaxID=63459 RepID=UPI000B782148|nr:cell wall / vacuolar inhibitor of fructosidase 1-like [Chenopodium quinoa]
MHSIIVKIALFFVFFASPSTLCNGLMRKLNSETDPVVLTCRKISDFGFCVFTLRSDPRSAKASVQGLAQIALGKLEAHAKETSTYIQGLQKACPPKLKTAVGVCVHFYTLANNNDVPAAVKSLNVKAYGVAKKAALAAMEDGTRCQDEIKKNPSTIWQMLNSRNFYMHDLSQLSSDLIGLLK